MAGIETYLEQIKNAIYGKDVRQAIHDGIEECYKDGKAGAVDLEARQRIDELIAPSGEAPSAAEVTDARIGEGNEKVYDTLGTAVRSQVRKLDKEIEDMNCADLLALNATKDDRTHNGVTFTWGNNGSCAVTGTATAMALCNLWYNQSAFPEWLTRGNTYRVLYSSTDVTLNIWFYKNGSYSSGYDLKADREITVPSDATGLILRLSVANGKTVNETVRPRITNTLSNKELSALAKNGFITRTGNPIILRGTKADSPFRTLTLTDVLSSDVLSISGKNIYMTASDMVRRISNGTTYEFTTNQITVSSDGATGASVSSGDNFNSKYGTLNGVSWWHNYKFMFKDDTVVTVTLNASRALYYDTKIQGQVSDGTNIMHVDGNGLTFKAEGGVEYGFRLVVQSGFTGEVVIKPQIEISNRATKYEAFHGVRTTTGGTGTYYNTLPNCVQENYTVMFVHSASGEITATAEVMTSQDMANHNLSVADRFDKLTFGRTPSTKPKNATITFIDDDTSSIELVRRYHDVFAAKGVVGGYAVMTKNLDEQEGLADLLLEYEKEGFSCLYHCYYQRGDETRYWEPSSPTYNESLIKENFMRGLRDMQEYGFSAYRYWVTPYGVGHKFIRSLAKTHDMPCLFVMSGDLVDNSFVNFNGNCSRYGIPRTSVSAQSIQSRTKAIIDACVEVGGWLTIVTHANGWGSSTEMDEKLADIIQYCIDKGAEIKSVPEAYNEYMPYFYWREVLE